MIDGDPGAQPERTALAWQRTALSGSVQAMVAAMATLKMGRADLSLIATVIAVGTIIAATIHFPIGEHPTRRLLNGWPVLLKMTVLALVLGLLGVTVAIADLLAM